MHLVECRTTHTSLQLTQLVVFCPSSTVFANPFSRDSFVSHLLDTTTGHVEVDTSIFDFNARLISKHPNVNTY